MKKPRRTRKPEVLQRLEPRVYGLREIHIVYEGSNEEIVVRPPDLSASGMFISTTRAFPEGAVLDLRFRLWHTGAEIATRCEVRHCMPGVGVGVEFVGLSPDDARSIAKEIAWATNNRHRQVSKKPNR